MNPVRTHTAPASYGMTRSPVAEKLGSSLGAALRGAWQRLHRRDAVAPRTPTEEAQSVRELALQHQASDPRFAAELFAAADRHERLHGAE